MLIALYRGEREGDGAGGGVYHEVHAHVEDRTVVVGRNTRLQGATIIEVGADNHLPHLFGPAGFCVGRKPEEVPSRVPPIWPANLPVSNHLEVLLGYMRVAKIARYRFCARIMHGNHPINIEALLTHVRLFLGLAPEELSRIARGTRETHPIRGKSSFTRVTPATAFTCRCTVRSSWFSPRRRAMRKR